MEWQPIETAPRGWEDIILFDPNANGREVCAGYFSEKDGGKNCWMSADGYQVRPTHWMPLPEPPQADGLGKVKEEGNGKA